MTHKSTIPGERSVQLDIKILGREYKVACKEGERADLLDAVAFLDARMHEIKDAGKTAGIDRIAVMAALNLANELLRERRAPPPAPRTAPAAAVDGADARRRILAMQAAIDQTMAGQEKLL